MQNNRFRKDFQIHEYLTNGFQMIALQLNITYNYICELKKTFRKHIYIF